MEMPTLKVYDAAQAFEAIDTKQLQLDVKFLINVARRTGHGLVAVYHSVKALVAPSRSFQRQKGDRTVIASNTIWNS
eukprot:2989086-Karenia_brevis.AAC.1